MFILRRITKDGVERNTVLGESYLLVLEEQNRDDFKRCLQSYFLQTAAPDGVYGFVSYKEGSKHLPLYCKSTYFIMMGDGQTFANITKPK